MIETFLGAAITCSGLLIALNIAKTNRASGDIWLLGWLISYIVMCASFLGALHSSGYLALGFSTVATSSILLTGPFLYFYAKDAAGEAVSHRPFHGGPFALNILVPGLLAWSGKISSVNGALVLNMDLRFGFLIFIVPFALLASLAYPALSIKAISRRREKLKDQLSDLERNGLDWVRVWSYSAGVLFLALLVAGVLVNTGQISILLYISVCLFLICGQILYVGYKGLRETNAFGLMSMPEAHLPGASSNHSKPKTLVDPKDFAELEGFMVKNKPHLEAGITIEAFSEQLGWDTVRVSRTIRGGLEETFFDFINRYRVAEIKYLIETPENKNVTLLALALDSGFGSKSAFNEAFKKQTGKTPSHYKREILSL